MHASVQVGPYQVLRLIKSGGQGRVYLAYDTRLHRKVAPKLLPLLHSASARRTQLQEARILASIHSERIVEIHDRVVSPHVLALVMEYVPGCDLEELLVGGGLTVPCTLAIAADVAAALAVLRKANIVHGDLKASNVLIASQGRAKLTDFGIAVSAESTASVAGSLSALAPEQIRGEGTDVRTDLFALGCLIYRMLTGLHPFLLQGRLDVDAILAGRYAEICSVLPQSEASMIPVALVSLVDDLLQTSVELRPQNTHEVRYRLRDVSRGLPLALHASVADIATPFFRPESRSELPPDIPLELIEAGQSHGRSTYSHKSIPYRHKLTIGVLLLVTAGLLAFASVGWLRSGMNGGRDIEIAVPEVIADDAAQTSLQVYPHAIRVAISTSVRENSIGTVIESEQVSGNSTAYSAMLESPVVIVDERIECRIECRSQLCLLAMLRFTSGSGEQPAASFQASVFTDASIESWRVVIKQGVKALYAL